MNFDEEYKVKSRVWLWNAEKGSWHFVTIPNNISDEIHFAQKLKNFGQRRGFGSVKVKITIGKSVFSTSLFPNSKDKTFVMPIKASIRKTENINNGDEIEFTLKIIG